MMLLKSTLLDFEKFNFYEAKNSVLFVGLDDDFKPYLDTIVQFSGFKKYYFCDTVADAYEFLQLYDQRRIILKSAGNQNLDKLVSEKDIISHCIVEADYSYSESKVPYADLAFCNSVDVGDSGPYFGQGFNFVSKVYKTWPNIRFGIFDTECCSNSDLIKTPDVDYITSYIDHKINNKSVPLMLFEYLRNQNTDLFEVK